MLKIRYVTVLLCFCLIVPQLIQAEEKTAVPDLTAKGISQFNAENYEEALEILKQAGEKHPDSSITAYYLGRAYKETGNYPEALRCFRNAVNMTPPYKDAYAEIIELVYNQGDMKETAAWIEKAEKENVSSASIAFFKGKVLARDNKNAAAVEAFNQAKGSEKSLSQSADYEIANAYVRDRKYNEAKLSLQAVIAADPNSELATFAREYDAALDKGVKEIKTWSFAVGAAYQYDDNVVVKPSSDTVAGPATGKSDSSIVNTFSVNYQPTMKGNWSFNGQYSLYNNTYFKIYKYDLMIHSLGITPGYDFGKVAVLLPTNFSYTLLDESYYSDLFTIKPTLHFNLKQGHALQIAAGYGKRDVRENVIGVEERDANILSASAAYLYRFSNGEGFFRLRYEYSAEDTDGANWDNRGSKISASLLAPVAKNVKALLSTEAYFQRFRNINTNSGPGGPALGFPATPSKRSDDVYNFIAGLLWDIKKNWGLNVQYLHISDNSNFPIYNYNRNVYTAGIEYRF